MRSRKSRNARSAGFTLIELLIVVTIVGIISAILTPSLIDALQKANQRATVGDIRSIGVSWMSWVSDQVSAGAAGLEVQKFHWANDLPNAVSHAELSALLLGNGDQSYLQNLPYEDGWGNPLEFRAIFTPADSSTHKRLISSSHSFAIRSLGRDGVEENGGEYVNGSFPSTEYNSDIVYADGYWVRKPGSRSTPTEGTTETGDIGDIADQT